MQRPSQINQSIMDSLAVLYALASAGRPVTGKELENDLGIHRVKINRVLTTLHYAGVIHRSASRKYTAGAGMHVLAAVSMFSSKLISRALPYLHKLQADDTVVALGVLWRDTVTYLYHQLPGMPTDQALGRVARYPASKSSIGLALLSQKTNAEIRALYADKPIPSFDDINALVTIIEQYRQNGYTFIRHTRENIAVTIGNPAYAAIAVTKAMSEKEKQDMQTILLQYAKEISLGEKYD
jgi:DNA-binding IclR family transcriptional regulator